jgi:hypothetical protein
MEERALYEQRAPEQCKQALVPLGTDADVQFVIGGLAGATIGAWIGLALIAGSPIFVLPSLALVALLYSRSRIRPC